MLSEQLAASPRTTVRAILGFAGPFVAYIAMMGIEHAAGAPPEIFYPLRCAVAIAMLLIFSRPYLSWRVVRPAGGILLGAAVFLIWIGPDVLFHYRHFWLFENRITGTASTALSLQLQRNLVFLVLRAAGSTLLVPVLEELFWRGFLMRWLVDQHFLSVPLGTYLPSAFWLVAILFASEHGAYWEVGLAAGVLYNYWMVRTRTLADCILAHAVTNGLLSAYVLIEGQWQYWL